jgi:TolA-binding protein
MIRSRIVRQDWTGAVAALVEFADALPERPEAAQALLDAAALSRERCADAERAEALLRRVEQAFPGSKFAETARRMRGEGADAGDGARASVASAEL